MAKVRRRTAVSCPRLALLLKKLLRDGVAEPRGNKTDVLHIPTKNLVRLLSKTLKPGQLQ